MGDAETIARRGAMLFDLGRYEEAAATYRGGLALAPDDARLLAGLGLCLVRLGRHLDALRTADLAVSSAPDSAFAHRVRAWALLGIAGGAVYARGAAYEALRLSTVDPASLSTVAEAELACGNAPAAEVAAQRRPGISLSVGAGPRRRTIGM